MKKIFTYSLLCLLLSVMIHSCRKTVMTPTDIGEASESELTQYAEQWLYKHSPTSKSTSGFVKGKSDVYYKPKWENATIETNGYYQIAHFDIQELGQTTIMTDGTYERFKERMDSIYLQSFTRYIYQIDKQTGKERGYLMTIVPDADYMEDTYFDPFKYNSYLERDHRLSGIVLFHDINGDFLNGWVYKNGKIIATTRPSPLYVAQDRALGMTKSDGMVFCTEYYIVEYNETCYYTTPEFRPEDLIGCHRTDFNYTSWEICDFDEETSGGGGGVIPPNPPSTSPKAQALLRSKTSIDDQTWWYIERMLENLMDDFDCLGKGLYSTLLNDLNGKKLPFNYNPDAQYPGFNPNDGTLTINNLFDGNSLYHELFHARQSYGETLESMSTSQLNLEIEAYYSTILLKRQMLPQYAPHDMPELIVNQLSNIVDIHGNLMPGVSMADYNGVMNKMASEFLAIPSYRNFKYDSNRGLGSNFKNLNKTSKGC